MVHKLKLEEFAFQEPSKGIGAKNTISNGPDDGTLDKLARCFWQPMRHGLTSQAIDNGLTRLAEDSRNTGELNIAGHGNTGQLETGMGQTGAFDLNKFVAWNEYTWGPQFARIVPAPVTQITIWACHAGEGDAGSDLIFAMAKRTQRGVRAGTGFLYTNGQSMWWENGTVIQVATPVYRPPAVAAPSSHPFAGAAMEFEIEGEHLTSRSVRGISFTLGVNRHGKSETRNIEGEAAAAAVIALFASQSLDMTEVSVAGFITGTLRVDLGAGKEALYTVYNDRLAIEQKTRVGHYLLLNPRALFDSYA
jgi:hypothetical protein